MKINKIITGKINIVISIEKRGLGSLILCISPCVFRMPMASDDKQNSFRGVVKEVIDQILLSNEVELESITEEIWRDLSVLYHKYEDEEQKRAFREVMHEICEKISQGKWDSVHKKLYHVGQKDKLF